MMARPPDRRLRGIALAAAILAWATPAWAGPPYVTDDPEPTDSGHIEHYAYVSGTNAPGKVSGETGFDLNYGVAKDLQLTAVIPLEYGGGSGARAEPGDLQLAAKYRFLHQFKGSWLPDAAFFPAIGLPTGGRAFSSGRPTFFLPVWLQKDVGKWSSFAGGGYDINPGPSRRDFTLLGWAVTRSVTERLNLGVELYHQTPTMVGGFPATNLGVGLIYQFTKHIALLASGGPSLEHVRENGASEFYFSLLLTK